MSSYLRGASRSRNCTGWRWNARRMSANSSAAGASAGLVEREFKALAAKRAVRANGYSDRSENWAENTPELLRRVVDKYNSEPKEVREIRLQKLLQDPKTMGN